MRHHTSAAPSAAPHADPSADLPSDTGEPQGPFPAPGLTRVIPVVYDSIAGELTIAEENVSLGSRETLVWDFVNKPDGWMPMINFFDDQRQGLGPFAALRQTENQFWGEGNIGIEVDGQGEAYAYRAALLPPGVGGSRIVSPPVQLINQGTRATTPKVIVRVDLEAGQFTVEPERFSCFTGDPVGFMFVGLPQDYAPGLVFEFYRPLGEEDWQRSPHFGPFMTFCHLENEIVASGENGLTGTFNFIVTVIRTGSSETTARKLLRSGDPVIDREEDPVVDQQALLKRTTTLEHRTTPLGNQSA